MQCLLTEVVTVEFCFRCTDTVMIVPLTSHIPVCSITVRLKLGVVMPFYNSQLPLLKHLYYDNAIIVASNYAHKISITLLK